MIELLEMHMRGTKPPVKLVEGTWVAGGAVRRWFTGEPLCNDIDVFCRDTTSAENFIAENGLNIRVQNTRMIMFYSSPVQIILRPLFANAEKTIESFDYTLCQFAWDGKSIITTTNAITSTLRKHLGVNVIQAGYEIDSLRRAFKYAKQGYIPCIGTIRDLAKALNNAPAENIAKFDTISPERWD
jgi:hypothetical protein